jgi:DNA polymerase III sliding clamp (beta) subunit (PCNA family)
MWVNLKDDTLTLEAADGFRLFKTRIATLKHSATFNLNIPATVAKLLVKLTSTAGYIAFDKSRNTLHLVGNSNVEHICTQVIDGTYPDLEQVIPIKSPHSVSFFADAALDALAPYKANMGVLRVRYENGALELAITNEEHSIRTALPAVLNSEEPAEPAGFNPDFLRSIMQAVARKDKPVKVVVESRTPTIAIKITTPVADPDFVAALMPMFIAD